MAQAQAAMATLLDLASLQRHTDIDSIYQKVPQTVTEARKAMFFAMERHDATGINEIIHDLDAKITGMARHGAEANETEIQGYRHVINIGRIALLGIPASGYSTTKPKQPLRYWDT